MKTPLKVIWYVALLICLTSTNISLAEEKPTFNRWTVSPPIFQAGSQGSFDDIATKDPSIVYHNGKYHLFYTSKSHLQNNKVRTGLGYTSAKTLAELNTAKRYDLNDMLESVIIAPQLFYFRPHKLWYLVGHTGGKRLHKLTPVYLTNPNLDDIDGWSKPKTLPTAERSNKDFWIDFWVICDDTHAHLFYTDHSGKVFRQQTTVIQFPLGFDQSQETVAVEASGKDKQGDWRIHEASHIYHVQSDNRYLMLVEATRPHPKKSQYWDSRNRFLLGFTADELTGPWQRTEPTDSQHFGNPHTLFNPDGSSSKYAQVSHPELIRAGFDERLTIQDYNLKMLFQGFDATGVTADYDYHHLPWKISVMENHSVKEK